MVQFSIWFLLKREACDWLRAVFDLNLKGEKNAKGLGCTFLISSLTHNSLLSQLENIIKGLNAEESYHKPVTYIRPGECSPGEDCS